MKHALKVIIAVLCLAFGVALIIDSKGISEAVSQAVGRCLYAVIPSLFPFMLLNSFIIGSGIYRRLFFPLYKLFGRALRLDEYDFSVFLISLTGGYPTGAKLLSEKGTCNNIMMIYCYCVSPAFIVSIGGVMMFNSVRTGVLLYLSNALPCLIAAAAGSKFLDKAPLNSRNTVGCKLTFSVFTESLSSTARTLSVICTMITAFAVVTELVNKTGLTFRFLPPILEITTITTLDSPPLWLVSALFSLGGICTLVQTAAIGTGKFDAKLFVLFRVPIAVLSGMIMFVFEKILPDCEALQTFSDSTTVFAAFSENPVAFVSLLLMSVLLLNEIIVNYRQKR